MLFADWLIRQLSLERKF